MLKWMGRSNRGIFVTNRYIMRKVLYSILLCCLATDAACAATEVGWTGATTALPGVRRAACDIWTGMGSWSDLQYAGWPWADADYTNFSTSNPNGVSDFGTGLVPINLPSSTWNTMLDEVVAGQHDSVFQLQGQYMAKYGTKYNYCRPWWEVENNVTNLSPAKFIAAWNHAVPIIRAAFAAATSTKTLKFSYCYLPDAAGDPKAFYPGDTNVDVIDADIYASTWGSTTPSLSTVMAKAQSDLAYLAAFAADHNKPMGISEWGNFAVQAQGTVCNQGRGDVPQFIDLMFNFAATHNVLYMIYFDLASSGVNQTLADTPLSLARFKANLALVETAPFSSYVGWQSIYFTSSQLANAAVSGPQAQPSGLGVPNLMAYAFNLDPTSAQPADLPTPQAAGGHLTMSYYVPSSTTDITYIPEVSPDLKTWTSGTGAVQVLSQVSDADGTTITVEDAFPSGTSKRFMRMRVSTK
jgi:hypothetical protein